MALCHKFGHVRTVTLRGNTTETPQSQHWTWFLILLLRDSVEGLCHAGFGWKFCAVSECIPTIENKVVGSIDHFESVLFSQTLIWVSFVFYYYSRLQNNDAIFILCVNCVYEDIFGSHQGQLNLLSNRLKCNLERHYEMDCIRKSDACEHYEMCLSLCWSFHLLCEFFMFTQCSDRISCLFCCDRWLYHSWYVGLLLLTWGVVTRGMPPTTPHPIIYGTHTADALLQPECPHSHTFSRGISPAVDQSDRGWVASP